MKQLKSVSPGKVQEFKRNAAAEDTIHIANNMSDRSGKSSKVFQSESMVDDESSVFK